MSNDMLDTLDIIQEFIAPGRPNRPGTNIYPSTITIHNTSNTSPGASAKAHSNFVRTTGHYIHEGKKHWVSWHFSVDDTHIIQHLPVNEVAYHAGSVANGSSIAIEICMNPESNEAVANQNAAKLTAALLSSLGLDVSALRRHKDWTGKDCPTRLLAPAKWNAFVEAVRTQLAASAAVAIQESAVAEDFDIDHDALEAALASGVATGWFGSGEKDDPSNAVRRVIESLAASTASGGGRILFPQGISEISLTLPAGISLIVKGPQSGTVAGDAFRAVAHEHHDDDCDHDHAGCLAPDDGDDDVAASAEPVDEQLPASGTHFYGYNSAAKRFGTKAVIRAVRQVAEAYFLATGVRLGVGNISKSGGGNLPPHSSHKRGLDVDIRVPRRDDIEAGTTWQTSDYSRSRTQTLVDLFRANGIRPVRRILFNDPAVNNVSPFAGHDNHLHVSFEAASGASLSHSDDAANEPLAESSSARRIYAQPKSGSDLDDVLAATGVAQVLVPIHRSSGRFGMLAAAMDSTIDDSFLKCFELPDQRQMNSLIGAASASVEDRQQSVRRVSVFPRLGLAVGTVSRDKVSDLRAHSMVRDGTVLLAPKLSWIRPSEFAAAAAPKSVEWGVDRLGVTSAWAAGYDGHGVIVGHLDTGIDASHPALAGALHSFAEFDLAGRYVPAAPPRDSAQHGTHTAGSIAGRSRIGVAPRCQLASALVIEGGDVILRILGGLEWIVDQGSKVLSMSLGLRGYTTSFQAVIDGLWENDVLPVIAVGNEYANSSRSPGNYVNVLSVGAMGVNESVADFSSSQRFARMSDPLVPDLVAPGVEIVSCLPGGEFGRMSGTSMATPHVAGLAAILRQAAPGAKASDIELAILKSCARPPSMSADRANRGVPDAMRALAALGVNIANAPMAARPRIARSRKTVALKPVIMNG